MTSHDFPDVPLTNTATYRSLNEVTYLDYMDYNTCGKRPLLAYTSSYVKISRIQPHLGHSMRSLTQTTVAQKTVPMFALFPVFTL